MCVGGGFSSVEPCSRNLEFVSVIVILVATLDLLCQTCESIAYPRLLMYKLCAYSCEQVTDT